MSSNEDDDFAQAYNNAAERLFGKTGSDTLTEEEDAECLAEAEREMNS